VCNKSDRARLELRVASGNKLLKNSQKVANQASDVEARGKISETRSDNEAVLLKNKPGLTSPGGLLAPALESLLCHCLSTEDLVCQPQQFRDSVRNLALIFSDRYLSGSRWVLRRKSLQSRISNPVPQSELRELLSLHYQQILGIWCTRSVEACSVFGKFC